MSDEIDDAINKFRSGPRCGSPLGYTSIPLRHQARNSATNPLDKRGGGRPFMLTPSSTYRIAVSETSSSQQNTEGGS